MKHFRLLPLLAILALLFGCTQYKSAEDLSTSKKSILPTNAKVIKDLGNGWVVFEINSNTYLYRGNSLDSNGATEVLAPYKAPTLSIEK